MEEGETILSYVRRHKGKDRVPTLCEAPGLENFGACRVCSVEVGPPSAAKRRTVAACHTPVAEDMYIYPGTEKMHRLRRNILELVITDHPLDCLTCEVSGNCELQTVAAQVGIREVRYKAGKNHLKQEKDTSHPYLVADLSKCIACYRCVRACDEVQGDFVLSMHGRGFGNRIIMGTDTNFKDSPCVSCGSCVQYCPTAAISDIYQSKSLKTTAPTRTVCTYCGVGCNLEVSTEAGSVKSIKAPWDAEVNKGHLCLKGRYAFRFYNHKDRLRTPLIRRNGNLEPATWDEAYTYIADKLSGLRSAHGPDAIAGISSSRCTNEENYLMQKFLRAVIGTNNIDCCARVCHSPTAYGMQQTFGTGAATNSISDIQHTDLIFIIGANPTHGHPVTGAKLKQAVMKGATLIVVDPRKTDMAHLADHYIQVQPGTNVAFLQMMIYYILDAGLEDRAFMESRCEDIEAFESQARAVNLDALEAIIGVDREVVRKAAMAFAKAPNAMEFHGLGVTEHSQGSKTIMMIASLLMLTGNIGRPGVGMNPLRGQNNVQGAADMGVQPHQGTGYMDVTLPEAQAHYSKIYGVDLPPDIGYKIPEMYEAALDGKLKALWIMGEDVMQSDPNTEMLGRAMDKLDLLVVQDLFMTPTGEKAHVVLPAASFLEKSGTFTNGERRIQRVNQVVEPLEGTKADGQIIVDIMNKMGYEQEGYDPDITLQEIAQASPAFKGVKWDELGENGKQWPVAEGGVDTQILHQETFKRGRGRLMFFDFMESEELREHQGRFPFVLTTGRHLFHYNVGTMTRRTPNGALHTEDLLCIHPQDAQAKQVKEGEAVRITSARGEVTMNVRISDEVKPGILYTTFHFPEILVNRITSDIMDSESMCPEYKVVAVDFEKVGEAVPVS
jgi:formate dehydrogenase major subunit